ncbi:hypothetical protein BY996DRAFT_6617569 [Phakopsora pachyrhizi]|nr:hypothetical protein BY996DRAFT_6617569 [Phakopsora pachyrhizi]
MRSATESSRALSSPADPELTIKARVRSEAGHTVGGGATDEHSVGGGEDVINEEAEAEGSLIDLQAQPASKYEHIHPSESDSQHNIHHHPEG